MFTRRELRNLAVVATLTLLLWFGFLVLLVSADGPLASPPASGTRDCVPDLMAAIGSGQGGSASFELTELDESGAALVVCALEPVVGAEQLPLLRTRIDGFPPNYVLMVAWRTETEQAATFTRLQVPRGRAQTYFLPHAPGWSGNVIELALYLYPQEPAGVPVALDRPLSISQVALIPDRRLARLDALRTAWAGADPWNHRSLNTLGVHLGLLEHHRLNVALLGLWVLGLPGVAWVLRGGGRRHLLHGALAWALMIGLIAHVHWLDSLAWQTQATSRIFGDLSASERQYRQYDGELARLADQVRKAVGPESQRRIQVGGPDQVSRLRTAYHLRPLNVYPELAAPGRLVAGDLIVLVDDPEGLEQARRGWLGKGPERHRVRVSLESARGALVEVLE